MPARPSLWLLVALAWTLAVVAACLLPGGSMPDSALWSFDKVGHLVAFGGFAVLWMEVLRSSRRRAILVLTAGVAFALVTEGLQALVPGRSPDPLDLVADGAGLLLGVVLHRLLRRSTAARK